MAVLYSLQCSPAYGLRWDAGGNALNYTLYKNAIQCMTLKSISTSSHKLIDLLNCEN